MRAATLIPLLFALAACGGGQNAAAPAAGPGNESAGNRVASLSEGQRNAVFIRAIRDAGLDCQHVERSVPAGSYREMPVWMATCQGGHEWTIVISPDGGAQILPEAIPAGTSTAGTAAANGQ